ncbi:MAG TPA: hypothetical protein VK021_07360 [Flavobacteriaceae bacterium]|nr:hypothetical protein [Flavobacteriaceae bacterium]
MKDIVINNPLEDEVIYIMREVAAQFEKPAILFSGDLRAIPQLV